MAVGNPQEAVDSSRPVADNPAVAAQPLRLRWQQKS